MAFMSFEPFLYARCDLRFLQLDEFDTKKSGKYTLYELCASAKGEKESFFCTAVGEKSFEKGDELVITTLKNKVILFRNFTKNSNNFKEASLRHSVFALMLFCMSAIFGGFCVKNGFLGVDIAFFMLFLLGFVISLINFGLLKKQIRILSTLSKEEFKDYVSSHQP